MFLVVLAGRPSFTNASLPVRGVADPVVALQMARDARDVEAIDLVLSDEVDEDVVVEGFRLESETL